eukprot:TRINITY_DN7224_c0_g1_i1.p1 TRINITY_DN7224_c0_g1~~TRINITY_DN7224_c0_g1_i1.p1  ORF type:complete len:1130 (-),score=146.04 TRINITY_DN7224_c0_g1_i1:144-3533(-)
MRVPGKAVWPAQEELWGDKVDVLERQGPLRSVAWTNHSGAPVTHTATSDGEAVVDEGAPLSGSTVGALTLPYGTSETCCLLLCVPAALAVTVSTARRGDTMRGRDDGDRRSREGGGGSVTGSRGEGYDGTANLGERYARFVTARIGPLMMGDIIMKDGSIKIIGTWSADSDNLIWVIRNANLQKMARASPIGIVGFRFKMWTQGRLSRRWVGRTLPVAVPCMPHIVIIGETGFGMACHCGPGAEVMLDENRAHLVHTVPQSSPAETVKPTTGTVRSEALGREVLRAALERQWGTAAVMLKELRIAVDSQRRAAMAEADPTGRTALRLFVDGQWQDPPEPLQALQRGTLTVVLGSRRPYWWSLRLTAVCHRQHSFIGETRVGIPRSRSPSGPLEAAFQFVRPWSAPAAPPCWSEVRWSEPEACQGSLEMVHSTSGGDSQQMAHLSMPTAELSLRLVPPGEAVTIGSGVVFQNPMSIPILTATGKIVGTTASGVFDPPTCARLAAMLDSQASGPREAASLAVACGADPRALADDGLSPYTASLLGKDPCGLLADLDPTLRQRIRQHDAFAWAEAGRSAMGAGHADLVAAPLAQGLPVPDELAHCLLDHCFQANLPLLAVRVLARIDGQTCLLQALENAADPQWLRVAERILQQQVNKSGTPTWCRQEILAYAFGQIRAGRPQFRLLLTSFFERIHANKIEFFTDPAALGVGGTECPICFEPLNRGVAVAFTENGHVVCPHFLCSSCARGYANTAWSTGTTLRCPECRRASGRVQPLPLLSEDPLAWLDFLSGPSGAMARSTLLRALAAILPVDADDLGAAIDDGIVPGAPLAAEVESAEFLTSDLYAWVWRHESEHRRCISLSPSPSLTDRAEWFRFWDLEKRGALNRGEVLRAALRSSGVSSLEQQRVDDYRQRIDRAWDRCAWKWKLRDAGLVTHTVSCNEFADEGGLADILEEVFNDVPGFSMGGGSSSSTSGPFDGRREDGGHGSSTRRIPVSEASATSDASQGNRSGSSGSGSTGSFAARFLELWSQPRQVRRPISLPQLLHRSSSTRDNPNTEIEDLELPRSTPSPAWASQASSNLRPRDDAGGVGVNIAEDSMELAVNRKATVDSLGLAPLSTSRSSGTYTVSL